MGAWSFVRPCIKTSTRKLNNMERKPRYIGRPTSAAPATGLSKVIYIFFSLGGEGVVWEGRVATCWFS